MSTRTERQAREQLVTSILMVMFVVGLTTYVQGAIGSSDWRYLGIVLVGISTGAIANFAVRR